MSRNHWWDWLKIVACLSMLIDHLRFVVPEWQWCVIPGRIAMPLFSFIATRNFMASSDRERYLLRLAPFAIGSEIPFVMLTGQHGNVLILFLFAFAAIYCSKVWPLIFVGICPYGWSAIAAIWLFTKKPDKVSGFIGGAVLNPFPLGIISGMAALLPFDTCYVKPAPSFGRNWLLWFYPLHLIGLSIFSML